MITTSNMAPRLRRIGLTLGAVGIAALVAAALPELTSAGEAVVEAAASPAKIKIDNFAFAPGTRRNNGDLEERGRQPAPDWRQERGVQIGSARHRRDLLLHLRIAR